MWFAAWKSTDWKGAASRWEGLSREQKRGLTEAEVLGWKEGWPRKSVEGRISKFGGGMGEHPWAVPELLFCWPLAPTRVISDDPQLQPGALSAFSDQ